MTTEEKLDAIIARVEKMPTNEDVTRIIGRTCLGIAFGVVLGSFLARWI